jgi:photosystem II stability/assembly factor-like uncharacterized protein
MKNSLTVFISILLCIGMKSTTAQSWEKINTGFNYILMGIEFPGNQSQVGFAAGESVTYMGDGIVIKTTNGGNSWTQLWTGTEEGLEGISFPDLNTGYVCGWSGYFAKTTNSGVSWSVQTPDTDIYFYTDVVFKDADHGIVTAQTNSGAGVYATSNGGTSWTTATGVSGIPYGACYVTGDTYFLVTNGGDIQKSTDNGLTWSTVQAAGGLLFGIDFYNANIGIAAGEDGRILKTYDGGVTWQQQVIAFGQPIWHDFAWKSQNEVYAVGTPEFIYKSTDGGANWVDDFPQSTYDPALYDVMFTSDGIGYICGSQGWFYRKAPQVTASFTASNTNTCAGGYIQFTDQSTGTPTSWNWTFEGGNPATSNLQNPVVQYSTQGTYDVTLVVTKGSSTSTSNNPDMIRVDAPVTVAPGQAVGPAELCGLNTYTYTTTAVANAITYNWTVNPASAGTFAGTGTTGTLTTSNAWEGSLNITVSGSNACGQGPVSTALACNLHHQPVQYYLYAGGGYCQGEAGYDVKLEDSEVGVSYELIKNGNGTGTILPGTGNELSFGPQTAGSYTVNATTGSCSSLMNGICDVYVINLPSQATTPSGPSSVCNNETGMYTTSLPAVASSLSWTLSPPESGTITASNLSAAIDWTEGFSGTAMLTVSGQNECGMGLPSAPLTILVNQAPLPLVNGLLSVCEFETTDYSVSGDPGSNYDWTLTGGSIVDGQGTDHISVSWGNAGNGTVKVTETNSDGCIGISPDLDVTINVCIGYKDDQQNNVHIYPNPASDRLYIQGADYLRSKCMVFLINVVGQVVLEADTRDLHSSGIQALDIAALPKGYYTVRILGEDGDARNMKILVR